MHPGAEVLVVGAGPTGLMLANQLVRLGVRPRIIDRHAGPSLQTRALGVQARTMEIYAHLGIVEHALDLGKRATGANMWAQGRHAARVPLGDIGRDVSPYPFLLILGQDGNERLLGDLLRERGIHVEWNTELTGLTQDAGAVTATLKHPDGTTHEVRPAWVAGCDGARSAVRDKNGIPFEGAPYEHVFFVADVEVTGSMVAEELNIYLWRRGFHMFFPMRGKDHWRVVGILPPEIRERNDLTFEDVIPSLRQEAGPALTFKASSWFSTYRIHHRRAVRFRERRCFLLGDAAHIHSPVGGQGMNTGLQDAYNLAWKLAMVVQGRAGVELLDSYAAERIPVATRLLDTTDRGFSLLVSDSLWAGVFRTRILARIMAFAMGRERLRSLAFRTISQTGIRYPNSPLSESSGDFPKLSPRAGDRFPWIKLKFRPDGPVEDLFTKLDDTHFHLLLIGQAPPPGGVPGLGEQLCIHPIPADPANDQEFARAHIPQPSFYLLRPDGHVGLSGTHLDPSVASRYVTEKLHVRPSGTRAEVTV